MVLAFDFFALHILNICSAKMTDSYICAAFQSVGDCQHLPTGNILAGTSPESGIFTDQ